jgi:hypothetical protein
MFHVSLLESYHTSTIPRKIHDPPSPIKVNGEYEVEDILYSRIFNHQLQYLVHSNVVVQAFDESNLDMKAYSLDKQRR